MDTVSFNEDSTCVPIGNITTCHVTGVTAIEKEIFVIRQTSSIIEVYDCDTFKCLRNMSATVLKDPFDITYSRNALFVGTEASKLIHRIPLKSTESMSSWSVNHTWLSLSTMKSSNILVTSYSTNKLMEFTTAGTLMREITLQRGIKNPTHAIQMENDQFLVSHIGRLHRVCLIDNSGQLIKSYGGAEGSGPGQLYQPYHLATDVNGFCLVVEQGGANRVVMLSNELKFVKDLIPTSIGLKDLIRLCLDEKQKRLYVADYLNARVWAFNILP